MDSRVTRVAWLNRSSILYAGNDKWCLDPRVVLLANTKTQYSIQIQDVDVYDEGPYTCSVQTDNHPKTSRVHLIVQGKRKGIRRGVGLGALISVRPFCPGVFPSYRSYVELAACETAFCKHRGCSQNGRGWKGPLWVIWCSTGLESPGEAGRSRAHPTFLELSWGSETELCLPT